MQGEIVPRYAEESFVRLGWYLSRLGLALATIGAAATVLRSTNRGLSLFLLTSLLVTIYYLFDPRIAPDHFWAVRRYIPVTIPMSLLFIGIVIQLLGWRGADAWSPSTRTGKSSMEPQSNTGLPFILNRILDRTGWPRLLLWLEARVNVRVVAIGLLAALLGLSLHQIWGFLFYQEERGSVAVVEQVATRFPKDAVIVFENSLLGDFLAPPLKIIHGLETFVKGPPGASDSYGSLCSAEHKEPSARHPRSCILASLATATQPRPFFWVTTTEDGQPRFVQETFRKLDGPAIQINVPKLEQPTTRLPRRTGAAPMGLAGIVYQLEDQAARALQPRQLELVSIPRGTSPPLKRDGP